MTALTATDIAELNAPSKQFPNEAYAQVIADLKKSPKKTLGFAHVEQDFIGVKPQHVAHMLKQLKGDAPFKVTIHATLGVCIAKTV